MNQNQLAYILALAMIVGTALFAGMGINQKYDFFLLLGNVCCVFGNVVFYFMIYEDNYTWSAVFGSLTIVSLYALGCQYDSFRRKGCPDEDDAGVEGGDETGDDDDDGSERAASSAPTNSTRRYEQDLASAMGAPPSATQDEARNRIRSILLDDRNAKMYEAAAANADGGSGKKNKGRSSRA